MCDFGDQLGLAQATVGYHLERLIDAGLSVREKSGTYSCYRLAEGALEAICSLLTAPPVQLAAWHGSRRLSQPMSDTGV